MAVDRSQNRHVWIGVAILIVLIVLPVLVLFVPDLIRRFSNATEIVVVMPQAGILEKNAPVWIAGKQVGSVLEVHLRSSAVDSMERVAVLMRIPDKYLSHVRKDSEVRITSARVIGAPVLDILPGTPGTPEVQQGDTLHVRTAGTLDGVISSLFVVNEAFGTFFEDLEKFEDLTTPERARQMETMKKRLTNAMSEFRTLVTSLQSSPINTLSDPEFKRTIASLRTRSSQLTEAFRGAAARAGRAKSEMQPTLARMTARGDTIQAVLADIQARIDAGGGGLLIRAQKDTAIVKALHDAQVQLDSLIVESKRNPLRFWF